MGEKQEPVPVYCPFCGSDKLKFVQEVPRCTECRSVFFVRFSRKLRKQRDVDTDSVKK